MTDKTTNPNTRPRRSLKVWAITIYLVLISMLVAALGVLSVVPALFSVTMFDAPGSTNNPATIALFVSVASCPLVCFAALAAAWTLYLYRHISLAAVVIMFPLLNIALFAVALYCLETFYGGKFNG